METFMPPDKMLTKKSKELNILPPKMLQMGERDKVAWLPPPPPPQNKKKGCRAGNITHFFIVRATLHFI